MIESDGRKSVISKVDHMLWTIAVILLILWTLGFVAGFKMGSVIHIVFAVAIALLVVSFSQETMMMNQQLKHVLRSRGPKRDGKRKQECITNQPSPSRTMPWST
mgnify:CR=1 FL=1